MLSNNNDVCTVHDYESHMFTTILKFGDFFKKKQLVITKATFI